MNLFSPPTDSIYKFSGIAGLILFIYMMYYVFSPIVNTSKFQKLNLEQISLESIFFNLRDEMIFSPYFEKDTVTQKKLFNSELNDIETPEFRKIIYLLPDNFKTKYQNLYIRKENLDIKWIYYKSDEENTAYAQVFFIILLFFGEVVCLWGLFAWYHDSKRIKEREDQKDLIEAHRIYCQSCSKQFIFADERATNSDGSVSVNFCKDCYENGNYTEPDLTFIEAKNRLKSKLEELNYKGSESKRKLKTFEDLLRWRRQKRW